MSAEWHLEELEAIATEVTVGYVGPMATEYVESGIPFLRSMNIEPFQVSKRDLKFIRPDFHSRIRKSTLQPNDVAIVRTGKPGTCAVIPEWLQEANCSDLVIVRCGERIRPRFLCYWVNSVASHHIESHTVGAVQQHFNVGAAKRMKVAVPSLAEQDQVIEVLGSIDDRIALLRETNATLEAMAQALFKSWFVDFDPVHANAGTRAATLPAELQALFPSTFTVTPQGLVPDGWQVGVVGDVAQQKKGSINPMQAPERLFEHYSLPAFDSNQAPVLEQGEKIKSNKTPLPPNAVLLSKLNPHIPRVWLPFGYADSAVCSTEFLVYSPINGASKEFIYALFTSVNFLMNLQQLVTGTSNSHQRVKPDHVIGLELVIPSQDILAEFESAVKPLFERIGHNRQQAQTLAALRDTLLPRLISGQLRLPDAEAALAEAGA